MNQEIKHIVVVGAGPAGSATAIAAMEALAILAGPNALSRVKITLISAHLEGADATAGEPSVAVGETIPPASTPVLRRLGVLAAVEQAGHLECPGSCSVWGEPTPGFNDFNLDPEGRGYHLDRAKFDRDLRARAVALGVELISGLHLRKVSETEGGFSLGFQKLGGAGDLGVEALIWHRCDFLVDASGVGAAAARRVGVARNVVDEVVSLGAFIDLQQPTASAPAHTLVQTTESGWWYGAKLPNQRATLSFCTDKQTLHDRSLQDPQSWFDELVNADWFRRECEAQFGCAVPLPSSLYVKHNPSAILTVVAGHRWLAVGDAASSYDSMSSAGITKALLHGEQAGKALADWVLNEADARLESGLTVALAEYQQRVFDDFNAYLGLHQMMYRREQRFGSGFWRRRLMQGASEAS